MPKKLIISIDGGGIRGVIPLVILRQLQYQLPVPLTTLTAAWYGTSTGALIAAGILIQQTPDFNQAIQNVLDLYEFRSSSSANALGSSNPARALHKILEENFSEADFKDLAQLHVVSCCQPDYDITVFNHASGVRLVDSLKATTAVPGLFDAIHIGDHYYVDGFIKAKNPALLALENETQNSDLILVSLGTGILRTVDETELQVEATHRACQKLAEQNKFHYFRFNPTLEHAADSMLDTRLKNIFGLKKDAELYLQRKKEQLDKLVQLITA